MLLFIKTFGIKIKKINNKSMSNKIKIFLCALVVFAGSLCGAGFAKADVTPSQVVISQVQIEGDNTANDEFVEIYNPGSSCVTLDGWSLQYKSSTGSFPLSTKKVLPKIILPPQSYYLIAGSQYNGSVAGDLTNSNFSLSGSSAGATIFLASTTEGILAGDDINIVDKFGYGTSPAVPAPAVPVAADKPAADWAYVRSGYSGNNATDFAVQISSPHNLVISGAEKSCETPSVENGDPPSETPPSGTLTKSVKVKIYQFLPNPAGDDAGAEWAELQNQDSVEVDLTGWYLDDKNTGSGPANDAYVLSGKITAGEIKRFILPTEAFALNNSGGEEINLYFSDKTLAETVLYSATAYDDGIFEYRDGAWQPPTLSTGGGGGGASGGSSGTVSYLGSSQFKINEIFSNSSGDDAGNEWVEIYNSSNSTSSLNGYYLADGETDAWSSSAYLISTATTVPPLGFAVIHLPKDSLTLNNSGKEKVKLFSLLKQLVDFVEYADAPENRAWAKVKDGKWQYQIPTPGIDNDLIPELPQILISEILPAPLAEQEEFIEIFNNATTTIDLSGVVLKIGNKSKIFDFASSSLPGLSYLVLYSDDLPGALRNNGQEAALYDMYGRVIFTVSYPKAKPGEAYARTESGDFFWTGSPSPGEGNVVVLSASTVEPAKISNSVVKPVVSPKSASDYAKLNIAYNNLAEKVTLLEERMSQLDLNSRAEASEVITADSEPAEENNAPKPTTGAYKYLVLAGSSLVILIGLGKKHLSGFFRKNLD